ncbi:hypothetical protein [Spirosoma humi]
MKKHTEKLPIDELFARKLGNASLTPDSDGFARLQARMGQHKPEPQMVFWRNPAIQRYMAAAACLLLVALFGWLYWPSADSTERGGNQLATNQPVEAVTKKPVQKNLNRPQDNPDKQLPMVSGEEESMPEINTNQAANSTDLAKVDRVVTSKINGGVKKQNGVPSNQAVPTAPLLAQEKPMENKPKVDVTPPAPVASAIPTPAEQVADAKPIAKPSPVAERVLVVTIAEPAALVAARQMAKASVEEKAALAQHDKSSKETKGGGLWQQLKRVKEGEVFARQDNTDNDESGLLGRAYNGLKHSLEKDKTTKQ